MIADSISQALLDALGEGNFPLHEPRFAGNEQRYVQECIASTFVSSVSAYVTRIEKELAAYTGARRAVAVVNGTAALQVALKLAGVQRNDEVILPALTFVATANVVQYLGAVPHFADSEETILGLNPHALRDWLNVATEPAGNSYRNRQTGRRLSAMQFCKPLTMLG
jgi:perosamine synthetase